MQSKGTATIQDASATAHRLLDNLGAVILGKVDEQRLAVMALMCHGHLLIEDVPGVGKTMLAKCIARSIGCAFRRIQFTPDLLPTDITGFSSYNQKTGEFEFRDGPIVSNIVLADEINRASPKTQAALLECMEERQITLDGVTHPMPHPFMVLATQNPIEYEGTFPLPETELDRFALRLHLGYPAFNDELQMLDAQQFTHPIESLEQVIGLAELEVMQDTVKAVHVERLVQEYIVRVAEATRHHPNLYLGASPRGSLALFRISQARAVLENRDYVLPDDVKAVADAVLAHRVIMQPSARIQGATTHQAIAEVLEELTVPGA